MQVVVPDASVLLKWLLPSTQEADEEQALLIRNAAISGDILVKVPSLWLYEIGNLLTRQVPRQARVLLRAIRQFELVESAWTDAWLDKCLWLTSQHKVTFYDAAYHSLAIIEKGTFVTADDHYVKKAHAAGSIISLKDWH